MGVHVTARLAWHDNGWDGHVCRDPIKNTYCVGCYSYPGDRIAEGRDLEWEQPAAGQPLKNCKQIPPCVFSVNAFARIPSGRMSTHQYSSTIRQIHGIGTYRQPRFALGRTN